MTVFACVRSFALILMELILFIHFILLFHSVKILLNYKSVGQKDLKQDLNSTKAI